MYAPRVTSRRAAVLAGRLAIAAGFLSAVADRFGLWGRPGDPQVVWGNWANFVAYTGVLNWFLPSNLVLAIAIAATAAEVTLAVLLLVGYRIAMSATLSGVLLLLFGVAMTAALGPKAPLDYSVFAAAAASFLIAAEGPAPRRPR